MLRLITGQMLSWYESGTCCWSKTELHWLVLAEIQAQINIRMCFIYFIKLYERWLALEAHQPSHSTFELLTCAKAFLDEGPCSHLPDNIHILY